MAVDLSQKLASGITVGELLERAEKWWAEYRGVIQPEFTRVKSERVRTGTASPMLRFVDVENDMAVGNILRGAPWAELTPLEQSTIAREWHNRILLRGETDGRLVATEKYNLR